MSIAGYIPMFEAVKLTGYTDGRLRQMLRAGELRGKKIGPRTWMISEKAAIKLRDSRLRHHQKSA